MIQLKGLLNFLKNKKVHAVAGAFLSMLLAQPAASAVLKGSVPITANLVVSSVVAAVAALLLKYASKG